MPIATGGQSPWDKPGCEAGSSPEEAGDRAARGLSAGDLLATEQVMLGDVISIDWGGSADGLQFVKDAEGALVASASPAEHLVEAAASSDGRKIPHLRAIAAAEHWPLLSAR